TVPVTPVVELTLPGDPTLIVPNVSLVPPLPLSRVNENDGGTVAVTRIWSSVRAVVAKSLESIVALADVVVLNVPVSFSAADVSVNTGAAVPVVPSVLVLSEKLKQYKVVALVRSPAPVVLGS